VERNHKRYYPGLWLFKMKTIKELEENTFVRNYGSDYLDALKDVLELIDKLEFNKEGVSDNWRELKARIKGK